MTPGAKRKTTLNSPNATLEKYYITTFGCQMNEHDSEVMAALLEERGYLPVETAEEADLIIINTCAVRKKPEDKVASLLGKFSILKDERPGLIIAVVGCMTQQEEAAHYIRDRFHVVNLVMGTHAVHLLPELIARAKKSKKTVMAIEEDYYSREGLPVKHSSVFHAWLPIIYGCNNYCAYCVVPHVRGRERSRNPAEVLAEAKALAAAGRIELTLLGQNVNSYGLDLADKPTFASLLEALNSVEGLARIRFMTSHPKDLSHDLIKAVAEGDKICEHFHLPVQSGSDRILSVMNRRYSRAQYLELIEAIREAIPGVAITSDIIVGFPGEEEKDFLETVSLLEKARFDNTFSFIYSPRRNTAAELLRDDTTPAEKERRLQHLNHIQHRISKEINEELLHRDLEVLVEGRSKSDPAMQTGRTRTNKLVHFAASKDYSGRVVSLRIVEARTWNLVGEEPKT